jgi:hypothetical protein
MMKKAVLVLFVLLALSCAQAQDSYFGLHGDVVLGSPVIPIPGLQLGGPIADNVELRVSGLLLGYVNFLQVDVLYTQPLSDTLRGYGGGGGDVALAIVFGTSLDFGVHATAGVEYQLGSGIGLFGEVQPILVLPGIFLGKLNLGINFHY